MDRRQLGRYLGPSHDVGQAMCLKVLTDTGHTLTRTSVFPLSDEDRNNESVTKQLSDYDDKLKEIFRNQPTVAAIPEEISNAVDSP